MLFVVIPSNPFILSSRTIYCTLCNRFFLHWQSISYIHMYGMDCQWTTSTLVPWLNLSAHKRVGYRSFSY